MWVRGLKLPDDSSSIHQAVSHPMWVRGLKLKHSYLTKRINVAPYVGAWIETSRGGIFVYDGKVAPYVGAWIET